MTQQRDERRSSVSTKMRIFPETGAGGFSHIDGTIEFYTRIRSLVNPQSVVVDLGAGRGQYRDDPVEFRRELRTLRGAVAKVIGLDVDPVVMQNPFLDEAYTIEAGGALPLPASAVDVVVSDFTFEHITDPAPFAAEIYRILRPGGWLCARTPNKWGYIGIGARVVPNRLHTPVLRRLQPAKSPEDTFNVAYRMNTIRRLELLFPAGQFENHSYAMNSDPAYFGESFAAWRAVTLAERLLPRKFFSMLYVFMRKAP